MFYLQLVCGSATWPGINQRSIQHYSTLISSVYPAVTQLWGCIDGTTKYNTFPPTVEEYLNPHLLDN
jgi:hypothetical protein